MTLQSKYITPIFWLFLTLSSAFLVGLTGIYLYLSPSLPPIESLKDVKLQAPLRIYSSDLKLIGQIGEKRRIPVNYDDIPPLFIDALLAAEDDQFYSHHGISIKGLVRAASQLLMSGDIVTGGSTITMQLARNYFLTLTQTFERKFNEILLALKIEQELDKQEILELYVNFIFLGNRAYGFQAAAQAYYGKPLAELNLAQLAMLAGIPKAPSTMNPLANPDRAKLRRNWILHRMLALGKISTEQRDEALDEPLTAHYHGSNAEMAAPYIRELARQQAVELFGDSAYTAGYTIITTVDSKLQVAAHNAVANGLIAYDLRHGYRGPELNLVGTSSPEEQPNIESEPLDGESVEANITASQANLETWLEQLQAIKILGGLHPAAVTNIAEQSLSAILASGEIIELDWNQGLSDARPFVSANRKGPAPKKAEDVAQLGDVIRVKYTEEGQWQLAQVPDAQAAIVSLNATNGAVLSLIGGFDFQQSKFNRVIQAYRQPGSNFKPFVYTRALELGLTPATVVNDAPIVFDDDKLESAWRPENSSGKFYGPTRLRKALYLSRNLVSIRVLRQIGISQAIQGMSRFGFDAENFPKDLSIALGSHAMPPINIASGYATFANGGYRINPYWIKTITDYDGNTVYEAQPEVACQENCSAPVKQATQTIVDNTPFLFEGDAFALAPTTYVTLNIPHTKPAKRIIDPQTNYLIDSMLKDVVKRGTGIKAKALNRSDIAGKTGTTNGINNSTIDAWFSGYSGGIATSAWIGFDDNRNLGDREYGSVAALPIWMDYMKIALKGKKERNLTRPPGIVTMRINPQTGQKALPNDPAAIFEVFHSDYLPDENTNIGNSEALITAPEETDLSKDIF